MNTDAERHETDPDVERDEHAGAPDDPERLERLEAIIGLARSGDLEVPGGADEIVDAMRELVRRHDELVGRLQLTAADFQNFRRRAAKSEDEACRQGATGVVQSIVPVLDNFDMALGQDVEKASVEQIASGVRVIRDELLRILAGFGVERVEPRSGDEFDPRHHQAMMQQPTADFEAGRIVQTINVGYLLGGRVVRPAKVIVAAEAAGEGE